MGTARALAIAVVFAVLGAVPLHAQAPLGDPAAVVTLVVPIATDSAFSERSIRLAAVNGFCAAEDPAIDPDEVSEVRIHGKDYASRVRGNGTTPRQSVDI